MTPRRPLRPLLLAVLAVALLAPPAAAPAASGDGVRLNEVQVIGTHNSTKREISEVEQAAYDAAIDTPGDYDQYLAYGHATIPDQLELQDVRGLELDLLPDPEGGLYAQPLVRAATGLGPLADPAWQRPGIKVLHIPDVDYRTTCPRFVTCLQQVRDWSRANRGHVPLLILLELKQSDARIVGAGGVVAPLWDRAALNGLDAEIRSVFDEHEIITPDDVRRRGLTLEESVLRRGWPTLRRARGKVLFLLDNEPGPIRDRYRAGRPNLERRVVFTNGVVGEGDAAFLKRNDPLGENAAQIRRLVRRGHLVRTRSDLPLETVLADDRRQLRAALRSGAHVVSTDFPEVGMSARYDSSFVARLPEGGPARCNPVNAPRGCRSARLEAAPRR